MRRSRLIVSVLVTLGDQDRDKPVPGLPIRARRPPGAIFPREIIRSRDFLAQAEAGPPRGRPPAHADRLRRRRLRVPGAGAPVPGIAPAAARETNAGRGRPLPAAGRARRLRRCDHQLVAVLSSGARHRLPLVAEPTPQHPASSRLLRSGRCATPTTRTRGPPRHNLATACRNAGLIPQVIALCERRD
jgi:hypothetical protein